MIWIELLGPSGVGKSYWYNKFMEEYPEYEPQKKVVERIYESKYFQIAPTWLKLVFFLCKIRNIRILRFFNRLIFNWYLNKFESFDKGIYGQNFEELIQKYLENILLINEPNISIIKKIEYYTYKLKEFKFYEFFLHEDDIYIAEDGLQHLHPIYCESICPNLYFYLDFDIEIIKKQRLKRASDNPTTFTEFLVNQYELKQIIELYYLQYFKKIESIKTERISNLKFINIKHDIKEELLKEIEKLKQ